MTAQTAVQHTTALAAETVEKLATGEIPLPYPNAKRRGSRHSIGGAWNSRVMRAQVPEELLASAHRAAGGDSNRLWFADDGAVWVLNHSRGEMCISRACPACAPRR